jgi:hypothetical protein
VKKLIVVLFITLTFKVLLKTKEINRRKFFVLLEAWQRRGESDYGTLVRILKELEEIAPPGKFSLHFEKIRESQMDTKLGKAKKIYYVCYLPFEPIKSDSDIVIEEKENLSSLKNKMPREEYSIILEVFGIQKSLTDFL